MKKPTPKKEMHVEIISESSGLLRIQAFTPDAKSWLAKNAPEYGELVNAIEQAPHTYRLWVTIGVWDVIEISKWIEAMGSTK